MDKILNKSLVWLILASIGFAKDPPQEAGKYTFSYLQVNIIENKKGVKLLSEYRKDYQLILDAKRKTNDGVSIQSVDNKFIRSYEIDKNGKVTRINGFTIAGNLSNFTLVTHIDYDDLIKKLPKLNTANEISDFLKCENAEILVPRNGQFNIIIKQNENYVPVFIFCKAIYFNINSNQIDSCSVYVGYKESKSSIKDE